MKPEKFLDPDQAAIWKDFASFAARRLNADVAGRHQRGEFDRSLWELCASQGLCGLAIPQRWGGLGYSAYDCMVALDGFGYGCEDGGLAFALGAQLFATAIPLARYGSESQQEKWLSGLCAGTLIASHAMSEAAGGSAAFSMEARGESTAEGIRLSGHKNYCANAPVADLCLAYVSVEGGKGPFGGISALLLHRETHGYKVTERRDKLGLRTCTTGEITLDGVLAQPGDTLGGHGAGATIFSRSMDWERVGMSALHVGCMTRLLERAVAFARKRKPGGVALTTHQAITHRLADIDTRLTAARLMVYAAARSLDSGAETTRMAARTKLFVSELFRDTTTQLLQVYGSTGYSTDSEIARTHQDALASTIYSGTSEIQREIIARWLGC